MWLGPAATPPSSTFLEGEFVGQDWRTVSRLRPRDLHIDTPRANI
jgi:hypothetical protein